MSASAAAVWAAPLLTVSVLVAGAYLAAVADAAGWRLVAGSRLRPSILVEPLRAAAVQLSRGPSATERPDVITWVLAPALYAGLAAAGVVVIPWTSSFAIADVPTGIVLWGTVEALVVVAMFLHGWSPNSLQPLLAGYRFVAVGLSYLLLSMFVLIAAAIPAESLSVSAIVASQHDLWNVVRQPLGLPLFLVVALGSSTWGPLDLADGNDLAGGTTAEVTGPGLVLWRGARAAMLATFSLMAAAVFLGGWQGPLLPGPLWVVVKAMAVLALLVGAGHLVARVRAERFVVVCWVVLLPIGFLDLAVAGVEAL